MKHEHKNDIVRSHFRFRPLFLQLPIIVETVTLWLLLLFTR